MLTRDRSIPYQQNTVTIPIALVVLRGRSRKMEDIEPRLPRILAALEVLQPRTIAYID